MKITNYEILKKGFEFTCEYCGDYMWLRLDTDLSTNQKFIDIDNDYVVYFTEFGLVYDEESDSYLKGEASDYRCSWKQFKEMLKNVSSFWRVV